MLKFRRALRVFRFQAVDRAAGQTEMPEKGTEELFALASGHEGVGKNGGVRFSSDAGVFFDFRRDMAIVGAHPPFKCTLKRSGQGKCVNFGTLPVQVYFRNGLRNRKMDVPERSIENLLALASSSEGVGNSG